MKISLIYFTFAFTSLIFGQTRFEIKNGSKIYNATIESADCNGGNCSGKGSVTITAKHDNNFEQKIVSEDLYFDVNNAQPTVNVIEIYGEQSPLIFEDFNFDGNEDLAVRNGNNSGYGGPSYDIYVYNITRKKFVLSDELTDLVSENLGMFKTDPKRKRLKTFSKSGCCWHITTEYEIIPKKGLQMVYELTEDATSIDGEFVTVTTKNLVNKKWKVKVEKFKISDYYKE